MRPALVFAGPSLHGSELPLPDGIALRPPAIARDIARALAERPRAIGLVDGAFGHAPSVLHKELLAALDAGIPVLGAASLGAIRAAELGAFGMEGVGEIHVAYASGALTRDDAVLVAHGPAALGYPPLSVALVEVEAAIAAAPFPADARARLTRAARRLPYHRLQWETIAQCLPAAGRAAALLAAHWRPLKRFDAELLLARIAGPLDPPPPRDPARHWPTRYTASFTPS